MSWTSRSNREVAGDVQDSLRYVMGESRRHDDMHVCGTEAFSRKIYLPMKAAEYQRQLDELWTT